MSRPELAVIVDGLPAAERAADVARTLKTPLLLISPPDGAAQSGAGWFAALVQETRRRFPDVTIASVLDCGNRAGDALAAIAMPVDAVVFTGHEEAARRLRDIAGRAGATLYRQAPAALFLRAGGDAAATARAFVNRERLASDGRQEAACNPRAQSHQGGDR